MWDDFVQVLVNYFMNFGSTIHKSCIPVGELYWETELAGRIVPSQCKVKPGKVRVELKLKKAELEPWTDYEVQHVLCV